MRALKPILIAAVLSLSISLKAADAPPTAPAPAVPPPAAPAAPSAPTTPIDALKTAASPSEAVAAYARGANQADPVELEKVYVRKMIDFGTPEMADAQAHDLINRNVDDPPAMGVVSYMYAAKGEYGAAAQNLKMALALSGDDAFLLRTAGQLVGWYDKQTDRSKLTPTDVSALEWIRTNATGKAPFADAYKAITSQASEQSNAGTQPSSEGGQAIAPAPQPPSDQPPTAYAQTPVVPSYNPPVTGSYYYDNSGYWAYPVYTDPFNCYYDTPWRHRYYDGFGPSFSSSIFIFPDRGRSFRDHDFRGRDSDDRFRSFGRFDGDRFDRGDHFRDGRDNLVPLRPNEGDRFRGSTFGDRDGRDGRDSHDSRDSRGTRDVRPPPTFRGSTPTEVTPAPPPPSIQRMVPASPAPRDPGKASSSSGSRSPSVSSGSSRSSDSGSRSSGSSRSSGDSGSRSSGNSRSGGSSSGGSGGDRGARYHR